MMVDLNTIAVEVPVSKVAEALIHGNNGISFIFGSWLPLMGVLVVLIGLDLLTGIAKGMYDKSLVSRKMSQGMITKAMIFVVIIVANMLDYVVMQGIMQGVPVIKIMTITFYIAYEGISICENLGQMNFPLPAFIKNNLQVLKEKGEKLQ